MKALQYDKISWFPGHMYRAMRLLDTRITEIDVFIEVRDARIPLSSFNKTVDDVIQKHNKEKIVLMNKYDLCDKQKTDVVMKQLSDLGILSLPISSKNRGFDFQKILKSSRTLKTEKYGSVGFWMMIAGIPNVGKSNIINGLRIVSKDFKNNTVTKTSNRPCQTTYVSGFRVCEDPLAFLIDSPGILLPNIADIRMGMNLGLVGSVKKSIIGYLPLMEYLFECLGISGIDVMYKKFNFSGRPKNSHEMVTKFMEATKIDNEEVAAERILKLFQAGELGKFTLDDTFKLIR